MVLPNSYILYSKDGTVLWYVPVAKTGDIIIPDSVTATKNVSFSKEHLKQMIYK